MTECERIMAKIWAAYRIGDSAKQEMLWDRLHNHMSDVVKYSSVDAAGRSHLHPDWTEPNA